MLVLVGVQYTKDTGCIFDSCVVCVEPIQLEEPLLQTAKDKMMKLAEAVTDIGQCCREDSDVNCVNDCDDSNDTATASGQHL